MKRTYWVVMAVLMLGLVSWSRPAAALDCVNPVDRLDRMQMVVHARVTSVPKAHWAELTVERYHKGSGPEKLYVEYRGIGGDLGSDRYAWALTPVEGFDGLIEVSMDERGLYVGPCHLHMVYSPALTGPGQVIDKLGPGQPPEPGAAEPPDAMRTLPWLWIGLGAAALALGAGGWWLYARNRRGA